MIKCKYESNSISYTMPHIDKGVNVAVKVYYNFREDVNSISKEKTRWNDKPDYI